MNQIKTKCVFGPIPSRRLGRSLGIDLLPYKTCSMDCVYCECGATTVLTSERKEYFPTSAVLAELDAVLAKDHEIDFVTFSGVGEPTLHSGIGEIIRHIRLHYPELKICMLTNSTLLDQESVLEELDGIDVIIPSLDGSNEEEFLKVNRQEPGITLASVVSGLMKFRARYPKVPMWLEIFILPGVNDSVESAERFRQLMEKIAPEKVQLNSLDRPGVEEWVLPEPFEILEKIAAVIGKTVNVEIVSRHKVQVKTADRETPPVDKYNDLILKTLRSRPCTAEDLTVTIGIPAERITPHLRRMERAGLVISEEGSRGIFYRPVER